MLHAADENRRGNTLTVVLGYAMYANKPNIASMTASMYTAARAGSEVRLRLSQLLPAAAVSATLVPCGTKPRRPAYLVSDG